MELREIKEQFIEAIKNENLGKIEDLYEVYPVLEVTFIELLKKYGGYDFKKAQKERGALFGGWKEIQWLSDDIRDIFDIGMNTHNEKIIMEIEALPIFMANKALELDDHYLFQEFINFVIRLYWASEKEPDVNLKSYMVKRCWTHLKNISSLIEIKLEETDLTNETLLSLKDFEIYLLITFQSLIEESKIKKDLIGFKSFNNAASKLFTRFSERQRYSKSIIELEFELNDTDLTNDEINEIKNQIDIKQTITKIESEFKMRKSQMFFGLSTWIFENFKKNKTDYEDFYLEIEKSLPIDFKEFTEVFLSSHTFEADNFWNWMRWETFPEDKAIIVDTMGKIERYYAIRSLKLLNKIPPKDREIQLNFKNDDYNKDLDFLGKNERFINFLDKIQDQPKEWKFILNQDEIECIKSFKSILSKSEKIWEEKEKEMMRKGSISDKKLEEFNNDVLDGFNQFKSLRNIFIRFNHYINKIYLKKPGMVRFGFSRVDDKAIFFDEWHIQYPNWGYEYGKGLGTGENTDLLKKIAESSEEINKGDLDTKLNNITKSKYFFLVAGAESNMAFTNSKKFKIKGSLEAPKTDLDNTTKLGFIGYYKTNEQHIPVFAVFGTEMNIVLLLEKNKFGKLIQYSPLKEGEDPNLVKDIFYMKIQSFSEDEELINNFLSESIEWLEKIGSPEDQKKYLKEKVWIEILEKYEYEKDSDFEGYSIDFSNN